MDLLDCAVQIVKSFYVELNIFHPPIAGTIPEILFWSGLFFSLTIRTAG